MIKQQEIEGIDSCTFGNSKAAINLIKILQNPENSIYCHKVLKILSKYMTAIKSLTFIPQKGTRETALSIWCDSFTTNVNKSSFFPDVIKTHMNNVMIAQKRKLLRECKEYFALETTLNHRLRRV